MRRLAERLSTGATTLYWHVDTKDDVLDLALDRVFGEVAVAGGADWRADVTELITGWRAAMLRHPWSAALVGRPLLGPNVLARTEFLYATLAAAGFDGSRLTAAAHALSNYVIGSASTQASWQAQQASTTAPAARAHLQDHIDQYPTLVAHGHLSDHNWDATFTAGLHCQPDRRTRRTGCRAAGRSPFPKPTSGPSSDERRCQGMLCCGCIDRSGWPGE